MKIERTEIRRLALVFLLLVLFIVVICIIPKKNAPISEADYEIGKSNAAAFNEKIWSISTLEPCGTVILTKEPKKIVTLNHNHNDMLETFGYGDRVIGTGFDKSFYYSFYKQLPGFNWEVRKEKGNLKYFKRGVVGVFDKELFYAMDPDIIHIDPYRLSRWGNGWSMDDVKEIQENIAPFFDNNATMLGNDAVNRDWGKLSMQEHYSNYTFEEYTMAFYKLYNQEAKGQALLDFAHDLENKLVEKIHTLHYRPRVAILRWKGNEITRVGINTGIEHHQYRVLEAIDAFYGQESKVLPKVEDKSVLMGHIDIEGLLSINPDVIIMPYIIYTFENDNHIMSKPWELLMTMKDDPVGQKLNAFKNDRVYPGGILMQGPIFYIFQLEMAAKQLYPELFGEYKVDNDYSPEEQLFSRDALAKILNEQ